MPHDILQKLADQITSGIDTEAQVVYLLAGIRKLIERDELGDTFPALNFHCDWVLHPHLDRRAAKIMLRKFDEVHGKLKEKENLSLDDLSHTLRSEIHAIVTFRGFREELADFLERYDLPRLADAGADVWAHFLYLYTRVIEDIPLVLRNRRERVQRQPVPDPDHIGSVTVETTEVRDAPHVGGEVPFMTRWKIRDTNGEFGVLEVHNSFRTQNACP